MEKKWYGNIHYEGGFSRIIEAETEEEAREILWSMFDEIPADELIADLGDCFIDDICIEEE
jgi:hypothetical protein